MQTVQKHGDVELEKSLVTKTPRRRRRDRRRRRRRRFRRRRRRRRRRATPAPTAAPTPYPTPVPTPAPTPVPTVKPGKGKGGSLFEVDDSDYAEDDGSTAEDCNAYFTSVDTHLKASNKLEGSTLEGDPLLVFCNGVAFELDPSFGVKAMTELNDEAEDAAAANVFENDNVGLTMSAPLVSTISQVLKTATVPPVPAAITIWWEGVEEKDEDVRGMNSESAAKYGLSVKWLEGMDLASM